MIIEIDHIALASVELDKEIEFFEGLGYTLKFRVNGLPNLVIKKRLMHAFVDQQNLAFMYSPQNISIELVGHGHALPGASSLLPYMSGTEVQTMPSGAMPYDTNMPEKINIRELGSLRTFIIFDESASKAFTFYRCLQQVRDIEAATAFWKLFGFSIIESDAGRRRLRFMSPMKKEMVLDLQEVTDQIRPAFLDDEGFNCLAFISSNVERECSRFRAAGYHVTDTEEIMVNGKSLKVAFVRGPDGQLAEIITIQK
jgi:catechol 2,3-dioxygenase-like lactoylglutathione lyase family enzyme